MSRRTPSVHWRPNHHNGQRTLCGRFVSDTHYVELSRELVTCHICLYHMGHYVPLSKLREHQHDQRDAAHTAKLRVMFEAKRASILAQCAERPT